MALVAVYRDDAPWKEYHVFEKTVLALNFIIPDFDNLEGVEAGQMWNAVKIMKHVRPNNNFSWEVLKYVQYMSNEEGVFVYPPEFNYKEDDELFENIMTKVSSGPFPLKDESFVEIQAAKYLGIQEYMKEREEETYEWLT
jgi:hypothetical protein